MAKPYQPASPQWSHVALGISGAIWLDGDNDGRRTSARDYAERAFAEAKGKLPQLTRALADYDAATAAQAAHLYLASGGSPLSEEYLLAIKAGPPSVQDGFRSFLEAWRENEQARLMK
jgi:hypothetical protein